MIFIMLGILHSIIPNYLYSSSFKLLLCWLRSLTPVTELSMLLGMRSLAAALQFEIYWVYIFNIANTKIPYTTNTTSR